MKRLFELELPWTLKPTAEQLELISQLRGEPVVLDADGTLGWQNRDIIATMDEAASLAPYHVKKSLPYVRLEANQTPVPEVRHDAQPAFNNRCHVVVAGSGALLDIRKVKVETDLCTNALQGELNNGWRILAICVQPDQRRPDYVLGKIGGAE